MNLTDKVKYTQTLIKESRENLKLYRDLAKIFSGIKWPAGIETYAQKHGDSIYVEFRPGYSSTETVEKDLRPLVHQLVRKFHIVFKKSKYYDGASLVYTSLLQYGGLTISVEVCKVVPQTCTIIETEVPLSAEEIEAAHLAVKTTKIVREICCTDSEQA